MSYYNDFVKLLHIFVFVQPRIGYEWESRYGGMSAVYTRQLQIAENSIRDRKNIIISLNIIYIILIIINIHLYVCW